MQYLVVSEHAFDDIPIKLFGDKGDAMRFAKACEPALRRKNGCEASWPTKMCVYTFDNRGNFRSSRVVRDFEAEKR